MSWLKMLLLKWKYYHNPVVELMGSLAAGSGLLTFFTSRDLIVEAAAAGSAAAEDVQKEASALSVLLILSRGESKVFMNRSLILCTASSGTSTVVDSSSGATVMNYFSSEDAVLRSSCVAQTALGFMLQHSNKPHMHLYNWAKKQPTTRCAAPEPILCLCSDASNSFVFAGSASGKAYIWNSSTGDLLVHWNAHFRGVCCVAVTHDTAFVITGGDDGLVQVKLVSLIVSESSCGFASCALHLHPCTQLTSRFRFGV